MAGLSGTGRVADDVWLLAHNDVTGRAYVQPRPLGLGLAGGLLAELVLAGAVGLRHDEITLAPVRRPPADELLLRVLGQMKAERQGRPAGEWLRYLLRTAPTEVAGRLERSGYLAQHRGLLPWRGGRWVPVDRDNAFAPVLRVRAALDASQPLTIHAAVLAGLADACGLEFRLAAYAPARPLRPLHHAVAQLTPSLQDPDRADARSGGQRRAHSPHVTASHQEPGVPMLPRTADDDVPLRHGYTLAQVRSITLGVVKRQTWYRSVDLVSMEQRLEVAWYAVIEHLYTSPQPPAPREMMQAADRAVNRDVQRAVQFHGRNTHNYYAGKTIGCLVPTDR